MNFRKMRNIAEEEPEQRDPRKPASRPQLRLSLRLTRERYRSLVENAAEGIFQTTTDGRYLLANPMLARIYGYDSPREMVATLTNIAVQLYVDGTRRAEFQRLLREQDAVAGFESQVYRRDGAVIWISECARAVRAEDGRLLGYEGTVEDITARKRAETEREAALDALQHARDELEERVVARTMELAKANEQLAAAETEKKRFYRDVIRCVTRDRLLLMDAADLPVPDAAPVIEYPLSSLHDDPILRGEIRALAESAGMSRTCINDLLLAVGEATTNAIKHATGAHCTVYCLPDCIVVAVRDRGAGIGESDLPSTLLLPGYSKAVSLGMGFTLMLELVDRVCMATDHDGTILQLEKRLLPEEKAAMGQMFTAWSQL